MTKRPVEDQELEELNQQPKQARLEEVDDDGPAIGSGHHFNDLSKTAIQKILSFLPFRDLINCERVDHRLNQIVKEAWFCVKTLDFGPDFPLDKPGKGLTTHILTEILKRNPMVKTIYLRDCIHPISSCLGDLLANSCLTLRTLDISGSDVSDAGVATLRKCSLLRNIDLSNCQRITNSGLSQLLRGDVWPSGLEVLDVSFNRNISGKWLTHRNCIKTLVAVNCPGIAKASGYIRLCNHLPHVTNLSVGPVSTGFIVSITDQLHQLEQLTIHGTKEEINGFTLFKELVNLKVLSVTYNSEYKRASFSDCDNSSLKAIMKHCPKLERLELVDASRVSKAVRGLPKHLKSLRSLTLSQSGITDEDIVYLTHLKTLTHVTLEYCPHLTTVGLKKLLMGSENLVYVNVNNCPNLGLDFITFVRSLKTLIPNYEKLTIRYSHHIPDDVSDDDSIKSMRDVDSDDGYMTRSMDTAFFTCSSGFDDSDTQSASEEGEEQEKQEQEKQGEEKQERKEEKEQGGEEEDGSELERTIVQSDCALIDFESMIIPGEMKLVQDGVDFTKPLGSSTPLHPDNDNSFLNNLSLFNTSRHSSMVHDFSFMKDLDLD